MVTLKSVAKETAIVVEAVVKFDLRALPNTFVDFVDVFCEHSESGRASILALGFQSILFRDCHLGCAFLKPLAMPDTLWRVILILID